MTIEKMNFHYPKGNIQSVFSHEEMTALELAAATSGKVDECIEMVNGVEQSAIEATQIVDNMRFQQDNFILNNDDVRANLVSDNQDFIETLNTSKLTFENTMTENLNAFEITLNTSKDTIENNMTIEFNGFKDIITNEKTVFVAGANSVLTDMQNTADNISGQIVTQNVVTKLNDMVTDGSMQNIINQEIFADLNHQLIVTQFGSISLAVAALTGPKKKLLIPDGVYSISQPLIINSDNVEIEMSANAKIIQTDATKNAFIFNGKNCTLKGGTIQYPATFNGENRSWLDNEAVILVKGDNFTVSDVTLFNIYKIGIGVRNGNDCIISNCRIYGNYPEAQWTGIETVHYGIHLDPNDIPPDGNFIVEGCIIKDCVQGIFIGNYGSGRGHGCNVVGNVFYHCFNHGIYSNSGFGMNFSNNSFNACQLAIACTAKSSVIANNTCYTPTTGHEYDCVGFSIREAENSIISGNTFKGDAMPNSTVIDIVNLGEDKINNNIIADNTIEITNQALAIGIRLGHYANTKQLNNNIIRNNIIKVKGRAWTGLICLYPAGGIVGYDNQIIGNIITVLNNCYPIHIQRQKRCIISNNSIKVAYNSGTVDTLTLIQIEDTTDSLYNGNMLSCDVGFGANLNIRGFLDNVGSARNIATLNNVTFDSSTVASKSEYNFQGDSTIQLNNIKNGVFIKEANPIVALTGILHLAAAIEVPTLTHKVVGSVTVMGAVLGDIIGVSAPYSINGLMVTAYVSSSNTITVEVYNPTANPVNLPSGNWRVKVI